MSEPTGPTPTENEGWPPRPPMNPHPETASYSSPAPREDYPQPAYQQVYVEKAPSVLEGEKLAKTSTILGIVSIYFVGLILGPMAIVKAAKAEKLGVDSTVGKVTGWLGIIIAAVTIIFSILYIFVLGAVFAAASEAGPDGMKTGGFSNSKELKQDQNNGPRSNFDKTYEKLTPAEQAQMDKMLEQLDAEVSSR